MRPRIEPDQSRCVLWAAALVMSGCTAVGEIQPKRTTGAVRRDASVTSPGADAALDQPSIPLGVEAVAGDSAVVRGRLVAYASGYSPNIAWLDVDPEGGALTPRGTVASFGSRPSFLALSADATHLFAVNEDPEGRVGAYAIDPASGALTYLNDVSSMGNG